MKKTGKLLAALITALSLAMPVNVWADTKISSISLKIDSSIEAGDSSNGCGSDYFLKILQCGRCRGYK